MNRYGCAALVLIAIVQLACRTTPIGPPLETPIPADLSTEDIEVAIVAMLSASASRERATDSSTHTVVLTNPIGAMMLDQYRMNSKGWFLESWQPGIIHAGFQLRSRYLRVAILTSDNPLHVAIVDSRNLSQSGSRIHKRARVWLDALEVNIRDALGKAQLAKRRLSANP